MMILMTLLMLPGISDVSPVDYLVVALQHDSMYADPFPGDILVFLESEDSTTSVESAEHYFDFVFRENHEPGGAGDPDTAPVIDRFRVYTDGTIMWFSPLPGMYIPWEDYIAGLTGL